MNKFALLIIASLLAVTSCDELVRTQKGAPILKLIQNGVELPVSDTPGADGNYVNTLSADGNDLIELMAVVDREMAPGQTVKFTTTAGSLHLLDDTGFTSTAKSISVEPQGTVARVLLRSSRVAQTRVVVGAMLNNFSTLRPVSFVTACPREMLAEIDPAPRVSIASTPAVPFVITLITDAGRRVSDSIRVDLVLGNDSTVTANKTAYAINGQVKFDLTPLDTGEVTLNVKTVGPCGNPAKTLAEDVRLSIVP